MKYTSAQASKELKKLMAEKDAVLTAERKTDMFTVATTEDKEAVRPEYDFMATQYVICDIDEKIRKIKHALNIFNSTYELPEFGITIDQALVYLPQLKARVDKYALMKQQLPNGERLGASGFGIGRQNAMIEYRYPNYDVKDAAKLYDRLSTELYKLQNAIDLANNTVAEVEFDL